jgi:hypothetical protein
MLCPHRLYWDLVQYRAYGLGVSNIEEFVHGLQLGIPLFKQIKLEAFEYARVVLQL